MTPTFDLIWMALTIPAFALAAALPALPPGGRWKAAGLALTAAWVGFAGWIAVGRPADDFAIFWHAGADVWAGRDPYREAAAAGRVFVSPPTALAPFAGLALAPLRPAFVGWTVLTAGFGLALVPLCRWALAPLRAAGEADGLAAGDAWALAAAVGLSNAFRSNLLLGQMAVATAVLLVVVVGAWARRWPVVGAAGLALATVKVGTAVPFGFLFTRPGDWKVWAAGTGFVAAMLLAAAPPAELPDRVRAALDAIRANAEPGMINDYSNAGPHSADQLGFDKLAYNLGLTDRGLIRAVQGVCVAALSAWAALEAAVFRTRPPAARCCLMALIGVVFLYHRNYDTILLTLPVVYCVGQARLCRPGWGYHWAAAVCCLGVMFMPRKVLFLLTHSPAVAAPYFWPVRAAVLPISTWLVLAAMACLWRGSGRGRL